MLFDEKGYAFTPLTLLLFVPIVILAISYGNIVSEANMLANIATGGDVTYTVSKDIIHDMKLASEQSGRRAAYLAESKVINNSVEGSKTPFFGKGKSKEYIKKIIVNEVNNNLINNSYSLSKGTGRDIYIHGKRLDDDNKHPILDSDIEIYQKDPFGFYVNIKGEIPIWTVQEGQVYMGKTPDITTYVSIEGLEDAYIWVNAKNRYSNVINAYPYYSNLSDKGNTVKKQYFFDNVYNTSDSQLHYLWEEYTGTGNPTGYTPRPYYFPDDGGLSFFERLENGSNDADNPKYTKLSSFVLGDPAYENNYGGATDDKYYTSCVDWEYFQDKTPGYIIKLYNKTNKQQCIKEYIEEPWLPDYSNVGYRVMLSERSLKEFGFNYGFNESDKPYEVRVYV